VPVATKFWVKPSFKFGGLVGEIAIDVKVAVTLPVVVVFVEEEDDDVVVVLTVFTAVVVLEETDADVVVVAAGDEEEQAGKTIVKTITNPITRQGPNNCIFLNFIVKCPPL
jgi:hypothetical protein